MTGAGKQVGKVVDPSVAAMKAAELNFKAISNIKGDKVEDVPAKKGFEVDNTKASFKKFEKSGKINAGLFAESASVEDKKIPGDTPRVHVLADALSEKNPTRREGRMLMMALEELRAQEAKNLEIA